LTKHLSWAIVLGLFNILSRRKRMTPEALIESVEKMPLNPHQKNMILCYIYPMLAGICEFADCPGCYKSKSFINQLSQK